MAEIRFSGFGGQGIVRCGLITGKALSLYDNKYATMTQSFGPEARGSACSSQLVVSEERVLYPYIDVPQILVSMSQEAYDKYWIFYLMETCILLASTSMEAVSRQVDRESKYSRKDLERDICENIEILEIRQGDIVNINDITMIMDETTLKPQRPCLCNPGKMLSILKQIAEELDIGTPELYEQS